MIDLTPIFQAVIALLAALVTYKLIPWIKSRTTETQQKNLVAMTRIAVYAAEQLYGAGNGDQKLEYARMILLNAGYNVDTDILRAAIESAVGDCFPHLLLLPAAESGESAPETDEDEGGAAENEADADDAFAPETPEAEGGERAPETDEDEGGAAENEAGADDAFAPETPAAESGESGDAPGVIEPPPDENA